jgi:hypothetical protein
MSTRATYRISESIRGDNLTNYFYIHYDGYPEGAAIYFKQLLTYKSNAEEAHRKTFAGCFEIGLKYSEKTEDHEVHGDTDYRYNLYFHDKRRILRAYKRKLIGSTIEDISEMWTQFYADDLDKFIDKYSKPEES